jgi:hypothetical protein
MPVDAKDHDGERESGSGEQDIVETIECIDAPEDVFATYTNSAFAQVAADKEFINRIREKGITWRGVVEAIESALPPLMDNRNKEAYNLVRRFLDETFGPKKWATEKRPSRSGGAPTTWVVIP